MTMLDNVGPCMCRGTQSTLSALKDDIRYAPTVSARRPSTLTRLTRALCYCVTAFEQLFYALRAGSDVILDFAIMF